MLQPVIDPGGAAVNVTVDGISVSVPLHASAAAAVLASGLVASRETPLSGAPRAPYCMMGVCFECLVEIDGVPNRQGCLVPVREGMQISRQRGARRTDT